MHVLKSVGVLSVARMTGLVYGCMGFIAAPFFLLIGVAGLMAGHSNPLGGAIGIVLAIFVPIVYGLMGFLMGALGALLYNLFARWLGGFELELEPRSQTLIAPYPIIPPVTPGSSLSGSTS